MFDEPSITTRDAQPYVAIVTAVTMEGFDVVEGLTDEVVTWIGARGAVPAGSPLVRIVTSDMSGELDIEVGVPVNDPPPGRRSLRHRINSPWIVRDAHLHRHDHLQANIELQAWAASQGLAWEIDRSSGVERWSGRFEVFRTDLSSEGKPVFELTYQISESAAP